MLDVSYAGTIPTLELQSAVRPILSGPWDVEISIDNRKVPIPDAWECALWHSDADCDYLELQCMLDDTLRLDRQILLPRKEHFAILADAVVGATGHRISYTARLPLAAGFKGVADRATRECLCQHAKQTVRVFPLALPQDRVQGSAGQLIATESCLELQQVGAGSGLFAPIFLDWEPGRRRTAVDWRSLTVTEDGTIVRPGVAAGHRLRIGKQQWLFYRSLQRPREARSVLGHHTFHETVIGHFSPSGEVTPLMAVDETT